MTGSQKKNQKKKNLVWLSISVFLNLEDWNQIFKAYLSLKPRTTFWMRMTLSVMALSLSISSSMSWWSYAEKQNAHTKLGLETTKVCPKYHNKSIYPVAAEMFCDYLSAFTTRPEWTLFVILKWRHSEHRFNVAAFQSSNVTHSIKHKRLKLLLSLRPVICPSVLSGKCGCWPAVTPLHVLLPVYLPVQPSSEAWWRPAWNH